MKQILVRVGLAAMLSLTSGYVLASNCPKLMKQIDAALPAAKLSAAQLDEVNKLRADGEAQHKAGKHDESIASLTKAKLMLGIK